MNKCLSFLTSFFSLLFLGVACTPDAPEYPFRIKTVEYEGQNNEIVVPVPGAHVYVAPNTPRSEVEFEGYTNSNGEVTFMYTLDALFHIQAIQVTHEIDSQLIGIDSTGYPDFPPTPIYFYDTLSTDYLRGCNIIKLKEDEEAYVEVEMVPWTPEEGDCF
ncbi:MAG: hypothetical protein JJU02_02695 [Cryomorphaceae bacterium]|nr:hypothetical protein [Cryomorphaceae bacterium]